MKTEAIVAQALKRERTGWFLKSHRKFSLPQIESARAEEARHEVEALLPLVHSFLLPWNSPLANVHPSLRDC